MNNSYLKITITSFKMKLAVNVGWNACLFLFSFMTGVGDKWAECKGGGGT
jgi:hypothetical protein